MKLDVTDRQAYAAAADEVERLFGSPPQLLFNTAGVNTFGPVEASTFEDYDWVLGVDLGGVINGMVTFVPRMIKAGRGGHITTVSSWACFSGGATTGPYSAAKAAVSNLMESYYLALKPYGIGVSVVCPQGIKSNIGESTLTRPDHLENTGYNVDDKTIGFMRYHYSFGMEPVELAQILKRAIENEVLYVIPLPDPEKALRDSFERIIDYTTPEGMKRQDEAEKTRREERTKNPARNVQGGREAGWGKARPDITWVKAR
jgi:NAD(P)-dependent dehydrogenase (short-subunit alcohol dehydrogenase family)